MVELKGTSSIYGTGDFFVKDNVLYVYEGAYLWPLLHLNIYADTDKRNDVVEIEPCIINEGENTIIDINNVQSDESPALAVINGRMFVPMRYTFEQLGAKVTWIEETNTARADMNGSYVLYTIGSSTFVANQAQLTTESPIELYNDMTYIPIETLEPCVQYVRWDKAANIVFVKNFD